MSLEESVGAVMRFLPPELLSSKSADRIAETARWFPDALSPQFGFECRLADDSGTVDFIMRVTPAGGAREILAGLHGNIGLPAPLAAHAAWQKLRSFCESWADSASPISRHTQSLWLEFDTAATKELPIPGVFFNVSNLDYSKGGSKVKKASATDYGWVLETGIPLLSGPLPDAIGQRLARCFDCVSGNLLQIGLFPARRLDAVRLFVYTPTQADFLSYLECSGWDGEPSELAAIIDPLFQIGDQIYLDLDVGSITYPRIGIECQFDDLRQPGQEPRWPKLLDHLVASGVCTPAKRDALLSFPGSSVEDFIYQRVFFRGLHHIKLVYQRGRPVEAKAYLGGRHQPASTVNPSLQGQVLQA